MDSNATNSMTSHVIELNRSWLWFCQELTPVLSLVEKFSQVPDRNVGAAHVQLVVDIGDLALIATIRDRGCANRRVNSPRCGRSA